jgi:hypothetical protein
MNIEQMKVKDLKRYENFTHKKAVLLNGEEGKTDK